MLPALIVVLMIKFFETCFFLKALKVVEDKTEERVFVYKNLLIAFYKNVEPLKIDEIV